MNKEQNKSCETSCEDTSCEKSSETCECENSACEEKDASCKEQSAEEQIVALNEQIAKLKEDNLRDHADFENMKKRLEKEKYQAISYAHEGFARDLLPILDALENALINKQNEEDASSEMVKNYKEGIELTIEQFRKCFDKHNIKVVSLEGEFDPNFHEAIMKVDGDEIPSGHIVQTLQKGYTINDRVLRAAMVSIAK